MRMPDDANNKPDHNEDIVIDALMKSENAINPGDPDAARIVIGKVIKALAKSPENTIEQPRPETITPQAPPPWSLQQFFNGEINLDVELANRFKNMPVMAALHFRDLGMRPERGVATLSAQDGSAQVVIDADRQTHVIQLAFTYGSMLTLRFQLSQLNDIDRQRWLALMRRERGGLAFLWGPPRWESDYLICVSRKYFTNLFAFSPNNFEAAVRMTPDVTKRLIAWLDEFWETEEDKPNKDTPPDLLTW